MVKRTILFTESGTFGGGSFMSLHQILGGIDRTRYEPVVVFVNETEWLARVRDMGITCHVLTDPVYSLCVHRRVRKWLEQLEEGVFRHAPWAGNMVHCLCHGPLIRGLVRLIKEHGADLLYMNDQIDRDFFGLEVARRTGVPCISHLRSMNGEPFTPGKARQANEQVQTFISRAGVVKEYWVDRGLDPTKVRVIENGLALASVAPAKVHAEFGLAPGTRLIGCVGRIIPEKGHSFLVDGFARLRHSRSDAALLIVGDGPYEDAVKQQVAEAGVPGVIFAGKRNDAPALMAAMDILVQPSSSDSFGRTVVEAMVADTPVVCSDTGGIREILRHGENGLLVGYGDVAAMAEALCNLLDDSDMVSKLVGAGRETVRTGYDLHSKINEICGVIDQAVAASSTRTR